MKLPRDISGKDLIKALSFLDYEVTRQTGNHIRLTTKRNGEHHITVPAHNPIKSSRRAICEVYQNEIRS